MKLKGTISTAMALSIALNFVAFAQEHTTYKDKTTEMKTEGDKVVFKTPTSSLGVDTGGVATGTAFLISAFGEIRKGKQGDGAAILTSAVIGLGSVFGGITYIASAADIPPTDRETMKVFRESETYKQLVKSFGKDKAEDMILDIYAGWSLEKIIEKYVKDEKEKKVLMALIVEEKEKAKKIAATQPSEKVEVVSAPLSSDSKGSQVAAPATQPATPPSAEGKHN